MGDMMGVDLVDVPPEMAEAARRTVLARVPDEQAQQEILAALGLDR